MKKHRLLILLATLLFTQCQFYQNLPKADDESPSDNTIERYQDNNYPDTSTDYNYTTKAEPGKCYAKGMIFKEGKKLSKWIEVLCPGEVTQLVVHQVQNALRAEDYYQGTNSSRLDEETKDALTAYQKDNGLPIGNLDFNTLDMLRISH